jgi:hypothetical protein
MKVAIGFIFLIITLISCKKEEDRICLKSSGNLDSLVLFTDSFNKLFLHEHLVFELVQDSIDKVVITGGENLIQHVAVTVTDGTLDIVNRNKCSFLRSYNKKIKVRIHFKSLINMHLEITEPMSNIGKMKFDWLTFLLKDGSGSVNLQFDAQAIFATISHGWGDFTFTGSTRYANLNMRSNGYCNLYGMNVADSVTIISNTQGSVKISANGIKLKAQTLSDGNIYYKGIPSSIQFDRFANGELIQVKD